MSASNPLVEVERPRNIRLERELTALAARAVGLTSTHGLDDFSDYRAWPGGVRHGARDLTRELAEELADARSYAVWVIEALYDDYLAGDPEACDNYERTMRALSHVIKAWTELHTESA